MMFLGSPAARWKSKLITSSTTLVVPPDVGMVYVDASQPGSGGGGGNPTPGGGGGGGCCGLCVEGVRWSVVPGETLTITIPAPGLGGDPGQDAGPVYGLVSIVGSSTFAVGDDIMGGKSGGNPNGGNSGRFGWLGDLVAGGAEAGASGNAGYLGANTGDLVVAFSDHIARQRYGLPGAGGALNCNGGSSTPVKDYAHAFWGGTGGSLGGGGGSGGSNLFGLGGRGGSNGAAGANATGYGAGGGGGSGNSKGGDGSPGFVRFYYFSAYDW